MFGAGLSLSGMTQPEKVLGFLDVSGQWDPRLAFVMAGALLPAVLGFNLVRSGGRFGWECSGCANTSLTPALLGGSVLFGVGWGLAGICPGPALVNLVTGQAKAWGFVAAMFAGFLLHGALLRPRVQDVLSETEGARRRE